MSTSPPKDSPGLKPWSFSRARYVSTSSRCLGVFHAASCGFPPPLVAVVVLLAGGSDTAAAAGPVAAAAADCPSEMSILSVSIAAVWPWSSGTGSAMLCCRVEFGIRCLR